MTDKGNVMDRPTKARVLNSGDRAWFYKNKKSIEVYCYRSGMPILSCRITRNQIQKWINQIDGLKPK